MPRTIVPPPPVNELREAGPGASSGTPVRTESIPEKLIKYVPAETLAFFVPCAALIGGERPLLMTLTLIAGALGTVGYLWLNARALPAQDRPLAHFYVLSVAAFAVWALATSPHVASLAGADEKTTGFVLLIAVFLIPLVDNALTTAIRGRAA